MGVTGIRAVCLENFSSQLYILREQSFNNAQDPGLVSSHEAGNS